MTTSTTTSTEMLVAVEGLSAGYGQRLALEDVSFAMPAGLLAVLGPNGGGKTTLFRALLDDLPVREGGVRLAEQPAYVPQTERADLDFPVTALDVTLMGAYGRTPWWRRVSAADRRAARATLDRVGLADQATERFGALSGGQRQRVLLARALLADSRVVLLDEPLSGVDRASAIRIEQVFAELREEGRAVLVATHDINWARGCDAVLCLRRSAIGFGAPGRTLTPDTLRATYGDELVDVGGGLLVATDHHDHDH